MTDPGPAESRHVRDTHLSGRLAGPAVREADRALRLHGGGEGLLDTTHFGTVRFPPPPWAADVMRAAASDGELAYTPYRGHPGVLDALAGPLAALLGVPVDPSRSGTGGERPEQVAGRWREQMRLGVPLLGCVPLDPCAAAT